MRLTTGTTYLLFIIESHESHASFGHLPPNSFESEEPSAVTLTGSRFEPPNAKYGCVSASSLYQQLDMP